MYRYAQNLIPYSEHEYGQERQFMKDNSNEWGKVNRLCSEKYHNESQTLNHVMPIENISNLYRCIAINLPTSAKEESTTCFTNTPDILEWIPKTVDNKYKIKGNELIKDATISDGFRVKILTNNEIIYSSNIKNAENKYLHITLHKRTPGDHGYAHIGFKSGMHGGIGEHVNLHFERDNATENADILKVKRGYINVYIGDVSGMFMNGGDRSKLHNDAKVLIGNIRNFLINELNCIDDFLYKMWRCGWGNNVPTIKYFFAKLIKQAANIGEIRDDKPNIDCVNFKSNYVSKNDHYLPHPGKGSQLKALPVAYTKLVNNVVPAIPDQIGVNPIIDGTTIPIFPITNKSGAKAYDKFTELTKQYFCMSAADIAVIEAAAAREREEEAAREREEEAARAREEEAAREREAAAAREREAAAARARAEAEAIERAAKEARERPARLRENLAKTYTQIDRVRGLLENPRLGQAKREEYAEQIQRYQAQILQIKQEATRHGIRLKTGGNYYDKYLKYKQKYLALKNSIY